MVLKNKANAKSSEYVLIKFKFPEVPFETLDARKEKHAYLVYLLQFLPLLLLQQSEGLPPCKTNRTLITS